MNAPATVVRLARADDAAAIATIYNEGIADRVATFETEPRTPEQIARQLADKGDRYPTVVVDRGGQIVAWAAGLIGTGRRMPESPSTRCMSHGVRAAPVRGVRLWRDSFVSTPNAASGRSCPGSFRRTPRAFDSTSAAGSASSASIGATGSLRTSGAIASSSSGCLRTINRPSDEVPA
jgi:hypothetical protein